MNENARKNALLFWLAWSAVIISCWYCVNPPYFVQQLGKIGTI
jgi:hypothetical protein